MAYIIAVNANIVADSGGTCVCSNGPNSADPYCKITNTSSPLFNLDYQLCKSEIKKDLITATAATSAMGTFFMGLLANLYVFFFIYLNFFFFFFTQPKI